MARRNVSGTCHLCGAEGTLSFEHVPPEAAFNDRTVHIQRGEDLVGAADFETVRRTFSQRGVGDHTLCEPCNNTTGRWYGPAFVEFARQAALAIRLASGDVSTLCYDVRPLRLIKQVACLFFSINSPTFRRAQPELEQFVRDKRARGLPSKYRLYAYLNPTSHGRTCGVTAAISGAEVRCISEVSLCPLGLVLSLESEPPAADLADLTFMADHAYDEHLHVELALPLLPAYSPLPLDFRDRATVERDRDESIARMSELKG